MTIWILMILYVPPPGFPVDIAEVVVADHAFVSQQTCEQFRTAFLASTQKQVSARCQKVEAP
jgi:hypothetical protein